MGRNYMRMEIFCLWIVRKYLLIIIKVLWSNFRVYDVCVNVCCDIDNFSFLFNLC